MISRPSHTEYFNFLVESAAKSENPENRASDLVASILNDAIERLIDIKFIIFAFKKMKVVDVPQLEDWLAAAYLKNLDELIKKASPPTH